MIASLTLSDEVFYRSRITKVFATYSIFHVNNLVSYNSKVQYLQIFNVNNLVSYNSKVQYLQIFNVNNLVSYNSKVQYLQIFNVNNLVSYNRRRVGEKLQFT